MFWLWLTFSFLCALFAELLLALHGVALPLLLYGVFYFSCFAPWQKALPIYLLLAAFLDAWFGRALPVGGLAVLTLIFLSRIWRRHGDSNNGFALLLPGLLIALINLLFLYILHFTSGAGLSRSDLFFGLFYLIFSLPALPLMSLLLEKIARRLALPRLETGTNICSWQGHLTAEELRDD